jgi:Mn2+/Fe2+ NRAMP family transporter
VAAGLELFGVSRSVSVPVAACVVTVLVLRGSFHRVEHILMALAAVFLAYLVAGFVAGPDWGAAARGLVVPTMPLDRDAVLIATATLGTTLAPWGLSFIQSYAVDKRLKVADLRWERVDVVVGAVLTGVIGLFVVVTCAATLHVRGIAVESAADAALALSPLAGGLSSTLFGIGLVGAALLAASVLPLSTAYSVCEFTGSESALDDRFTEARTFYLGFIIVTAISAAVVILPGVPLVTVLLMTQVLNAILLLPLLVFMLVVARDREVMGPYAAGRGATALYVVTIGAIAACVAALLLLSVLPT